MERLIPRLGEKAESTDGACPDSESLSAFAENQGSKSFREAIASHLVSCPKCREIQERLRHFASADAPEEDSEWRTAEKRLENWMGAFLSAQASRNEAARVFSLGQPTRSTGWMSSWKLLWAVGTLAIVAVVATTTFFLGFRFGRTQQRQVAVTLVPPPAQRTAPPPAVSSESSGAAPNSVRLASRSVTKPQGERHAANSPSAAMTRAPGLEQPVVPPAGESGLSQSATNPPLGAAPIPEARPESAEDTAAPSSTVRANAAPAAPEVASAQPDARALGAAVGSTTRARHPGARMGQLASFGAPSMTPGSTIASTRPTARAAGTQSYPASLHLEAGTRIWIQLKSVNHQPDGSFVFQGSLHLPVEQANRVLLERATEVNGVGVQKQGQTSISIVEFVANGVRYVLRGQPAAMESEVRTGAPGEGGTVSFEGGQVLETFLGSDSVYERLHPASAIGRPPAAAGAARAAPPRPTPPQ